MKERLFYFSYGGNRPFGKFLPVGRKLFVNFTKGNVYGISIIKGTYLKKFPGKITLHITNHGSNQVIFRVEKKLYNDKKSLVKNLNGYSSQTVVVNITEKDIKELTIAVFLEDQENNNPITISLDKIELK